MIGKLVAGLRNKKVKIGVNGQSAQGYTSTETNCLEKIPGVTAALVEEIAKGLPTCSWGNYPVSVFMVKE